MTPICPTWAARWSAFGIVPESAATYDHEGEWLLFCCAGCVDLFREEPGRYLDEISDWVSRPTCLAEKPRQMTVAISHEGREVRFCRCPGCAEEFTRRPAELPARLER
jgi:YHS domain-containing protein